ncbi:hypothetical protein HS041_01560 [Planomonospora sp. ID67723]|uniref:hypothetical protein n=1 Tax=Planomonospora sp. ID67723 TaxID=2738134 RepID=UPI0018C3D293|nr:hypothetical protein [Planomonospora sp. ID67723]MBG0826470.1 hypothetical protein [Planomonospora sp. ID67723]
MIEHADQLVLEYVSRAADAAHGVLRPEQRIDFVHRLRERIDAERRGSESAAVVEKVLARFGDPVVLVEREVMRLAGERARQRPAEAAGRTGPVIRPSGVVPRPAPPPDDPPTLVTSVEPVTQELPAVEERSPDAAPASRPPGPGTSQGMPPGMARSIEEARRALAGERSGTGPVRRRRGAGRDGGERPPGRRDRWRRPGGRERRPGGGRDAADAVSILSERPREVAGMVLLALAAVLVPLPLAPVAVFPIPFVVWAVGTAVVLSCPGWEVGDKTLGVAVPLLAYSVGGAAAAFIRTGGAIERMVDDFFRVSGLIFVIGTAVGVLWLAYRLVNPPAPLTGRSR